MSALPKHIFDYSPLRLAPDEVESTADAIGESAQLRRLCREMESAASVQRDLLPLNPPHLAPFDMAALWQPCSALGGDYYDFVPMGHRMGVVVGDVAGKGIAAALLMASLRASLRAQIETGDDLTTIVSRVNQRLARDTHHGAFATLFFGILDPQTLEFEYCSAGHEPGLVVDRDGVCSALDVGGLPLGIDATEVYHTESVRLSRGDLLAIYTDGVTEASNAVGAMFGRWPARATISLLRHQTPEMICRGLMQEIHRFTGAVEQSDDTTLVLVRVG